MVKFNFLATFVAAATTASAQLATGHYHIQDFQNRCLDFSPRATNDFVPIVTTPCSSAQTQIWNVVSDSPFAPTYIIISTVAPVLTISYASSTADSIGVSAVRQQLQLRQDPPIDEDLLLVQNGSKWRISDVHGGGIWTSWRARSANPQLSSPYLTR
ncbi:hypothetical protein L218DRAFT_725371 [Marasmius fiardii PR-910]|nr:hypothetical protein L218DRAFT_725371 [Marasmius fiardii PR-910]